MQEEINLQDLAASTEVPVPEAGEQVEEPIEESAASETEGEPEPEEHTEPKKKGGFQKRIEKLSTRANLAEQERDYWKEQALSGKSPEKKGETGEKPKPKIDDFKDFDAYLDARDAWVEERAVKRATSEAESKISVKSEQSQWQGKLEAAREKHPDFDEVLNDANVPVSPAMHSILMRSEEGAEMAYYLGQHPEIGRQLASLAPDAVAFELGKIAVRLAKDESAEEPAKPKPPKPPTPTGRNSTKTTRSVYDEDISYKEFVKLREAK